MNNSPRTHNLPTFLMGLLLMFLALPNAALAMGQMPAWNPLADDEETLSEQLDWLPDAPVTCEGMSHYINNTNLEEKIEELKDCNIYTGRITINIGKPFKIIDINEKPTKEHIKSINESIMMEIAELLPPKYQGIYKNKLYKDESLKQKTFQYYPKDTEELCVE